MTDIRRDTDHPAVWSRRFEYSDELCDRLEYVLEIAKQRNEQTAIHGVNIVLEEVFSGLLHEQIIQPTKERFVRIRSWDEGNPIVGIKARYAQFFGESSTHQI